MTACSEALLQLCRDGRGGLLLHLVVLGGSAVVALAAFTAQVSGALVWPNDEPVMPDQRSRPVIVARSHHDCPQHGTAQQRQRSNVGQVTAWGAGCVQRKPRLPAMEGPTL